MLPREMVMRVNKMITKEKMLSSVFKFSQLILKGNVYKSVWGICMWKLGLKGLINVHCSKGGGRIQEITVCNVSSCLVPA